MELFSPPSMRALPYSQDVGTRTWTDSQLFAAMIILEAQDLGDPGLPGCRSGGANVFPMIAKTPLSEEHGLLISRPSFG